MKSIRLLLLFTLMLSGISAFLQNVTLQVTGQVYDLQTQIPVANHLVAVTLYPDSIGFNSPFADSALTDQSGMYSLTFDVSYVAGTTSSFTVGTPDCMMQWVQQSFAYNGNQTSFTADFSICNDTILPPSQCENYIMVNEIQELTVAMQGGLLNSVQSASYFWNMGDGTALSGQNVTHTYLQQGIYNVVLQTITTDSCIDYSNYTVVLNDSINPPGQCENYIIIGGIQGLTVDFLGALYSGQPASYFWTLGDGTSATGQSISHTYAQQGIYNVLLQTITPDSCIDESTITVVLMDSISNGCNSYFTSTAGNNPYEIYFEGFTNSPYPALYSFNFGDPASGVNNTSSLQNATHTYSASGTYNVVLTTSDSIGCTFIYSAPVMIFPDSTGNLSVSGQVFAGNAFLSQGFVTLFGADQLGYYYPDQNTAVDSSGYYTFWNLNTGPYIILAIPQPDSLQGSQYLPTYYGDVIFWEQAIPIYLGIPLNPYNINLISFDSIGGGDGSISGQLSGGGKSIMTGGQEVLLLDAFDNPVRLTSTDSQGSFSFASLPFGEYKVNPVITGMTTLPAVVILDVNSPTATVSMTINGHLITGISELKQTSIIENIYPNPAVNEILVNVKSQGAIKIQIMDTSGKTILENNENISAEGKLITIPVSHFKPGLYVLFIHDKDGNTSSRRFVKN